MIPEYAREGVTIYFEDSANLEGTILLYFQAEGFNIHSSITTRIHNIVYMEEVHIAHPCAILYLYRKLQDYCPMNHFLNSHSSQGHQKGYNLMVVGMAYCYS